MTVSVQLEDFNTLVNWAEMHGLSSGWGSYVSIRELVEKIEKANGLTRYFLALRWKDRGSGVYSPSQYQDEWPPTLRLDISRYTGPWTYDGVMEAITAKTPNPFGVEITTDRTGTAGWTDIDTFFGRP